MKLLVAAASFSSDLSGVQRHALNVVRCLLKRAEVTEVYLFVAPWQQELVKASGLLCDSRLVAHVAEMDKSSASRNLWHLLRLPGIAKRLGVDLVHLSYPVPVRASAFSCPVVVSLHDLYPHEIPQNFGFPQVVFNRVILQQSLKNATAIACVSNATLSCLRRYTPPAIWKKANRIYNCVEPEALCSQQSPVPGHDGNPFLLSVAQHRYNKNIPLLLRAFSRLLLNRQIDARTLLFIVGIEGPETALIRETVAKLKLDQKVHFLKGLPEPDLQWCYTHCDAFIAPSITEGFGLPVVEALLAGCRVVCSDIPAFREIGGNGCNFVHLDGENEKPLSEAIAAVLKTPVKTPVPFPQFSASVLAEQYVSLYRELIASASARRVLQPLPIRTAASSERHSL